MSNTLAIAPNMSSFFREVVVEAQKAHGIEATAAATEYLVGILCEYAHPNEEAGTPFREPLTFLLRDALAAEGTERLRKLRALGDGVLYAVGFFGDHLEQRGADRGYIVSVGSSAYNHAGEILRVRAGQKAPSVFSELGAKFERFARVISDVAESTLGSIVRNEQGLVKLYERWLRTGSTRLASELGLHGISLSRGGLA